MKVEIERLGIGIYLYGEKEPAELSSNDILLLMLSELQTIKWLTKNIKDDTRKEPISDDDFDEILIGLFNAVQNGDLLPSKAIKMLKNGERFV